MSDFVDDMIDEGCHKIDDEGDKNEAETINQEENGVRHRGVYTRKHRESAVVIRTDVKHIEGITLTVRPEDLLNDLVEKASRTEQSEEWKHAADKIAHVVFVPLVRDKEDAEDDLRAVMHHRVYVGDEVRGEYVAGIYHNDKTAEEGEECHISDKTVADLTLGDKNDEREYP